MGVAVVTGASGHVGVNLVRALLAEGREVRAVSRRPLPDGFGLEGATWVAGDVRDAAAMRAALAGADTVFHLAARISITGDPDGSVWATNVEGTRAVVEAAVAAGARRLVHCSSIHAFDCEAHVRAHPRKRVGKRRKLQWSEPVMIDETAAAATRASLPLYGRSKAAADAIVREAVAAGRLDAVIVHPTAVIGPYDPEPSRAGSMLAAVARRKPLVLVPGGFDWVDVRDVAEGMLAAERAGRTGEGYLLGGEWATLRRLTRLVAHANGTQPPSMHVALGLAERVAPIAGRVWTGAVAQGFTPEALHAIRTAPHVSHAKAEGQLGYQPRPLAETATALVEWLVETGRVARRGEPIAVRQPGSAPRRG